MRYEYKLVQLPRTFAVKKDTGNEIADYLESIIQNWASNDWEFHRIDSVSVAVQPGCLGALTGGQASMAYYNVISFRREKAT